MRPMTLLVALAVSALAHADDTYTIKIKIDPDVGRTVNYRGVYKCTGAVRTLDADGKVLDERKPEGGEAAVRMTVLEGDKDGRATRYVLSYEVATETEAGQSKPRSYQGRTLLFERRDGRFRVGIAGEPPLDPDDVAWGTREANQQSVFTQLCRHLAPDKPVRVGDTWPVPVKPIAEAYGNFILDPSKSSIKARLVRVSTRGATRFGTFEINSRLVVTTFMQGSIPSAFDPPAVSTEKTELELAIDGSSVEYSRRVEAAFKGEANGLFGGVKRRMVYDLSTTNHEEHSAEVFDRKALVVPSVTFAPAPGEWTEIKPKAGAYLAKFPGQPKEVLDIEVGYSRTYWLAKTDGGMIAYGVTITDFADPTQFNKDDLLKAAINDLPGIKSRTDVQVNGFTGVDVVCKEEDTGFPCVLTCRMVVANGRLFQIYTDALVGKSAETDKFFRSFQLLEKPRTKDN